MVEEKAVDIIPDLILVLVPDNIVLNSVSIACRFPIKIFSSWRGAYIDTFTVSFMSTLLLTTINLSLTMPIQ